MPCGRFACVCWALGCGFLLGAVVTVAVGFFAASVVFDGELWHRWLCRNLELLHTAKDTPYAREFPTFRGQQHNADL